MPGAMLCRPCRAALKRARYVSVQDVPPPSSVMQARSQRQRRAAPPVAGQSAATAVAGGPATKPWTRASPSARRAWVRSLVLGGGAIVALGTIAYFGQARDAPPAVAAPTLAAPAVRAPGAILAPAKGNAMIEQPAVPAAALSPLTGHGDGPPRVATTDPAVPTVTGANVRKVDVRAASARAPVAAPANAATTMLSTGPGAEGFGLDVPPLPPVAVPVPRSAAPPPSPPPRDRWQTMGDEMARCDREGGIAGFICDQRVRITSCEGYWGRVPQCPLPPENPR